MAQCCSGSRLDASGRPATAFLTAGAPPAPQEGTGLPEVR
jgi:hypothetical protein